LYNIVILKGDQINLTFMRGILDQLKYNISALEDTEDSWKTLKNHMPDLLICSLRRPGEKRIDLINNIRKIEGFTHLPAIFILKPNQDIKNIIGYLKPIIDDYIIEPFEEDEIIFKIKSILRAKDMYIEMTESREEFKKLSDTTMKSLLVMDENQKHLKRAQIIASFGSWKIDTLTKLVYPTEESSRIYGIDNMSRSLESIQAIALPEYRDLLNKELSDLLIHKKPYNIEYQIKRENDGDIRYLHSIAEWDSDNRSIIGTIHDITERKKAEKGLFESEERFRSLFDKSISGILYIDLHGNILEANEKILEIIGSPSVEETKKINILTFPALVNFGYADALKKVISTKEIVKGENNYNSKWGKKVYLEYAIIPIKRDHKLIGVLGKIEDITLRKQAEKKIQILLDEKVILLKEVHHRIKNNMASIEGLLFIQSEQSTNKEVQSALNDAITRLSSMRVLYDKLYRSDNFKETAIKSYLTNLIDEISSVFLESRHIQIHKNIADFMIPADTIFPLGIIINELLTNAMKYAFDGIKIKIINISAEKIGSEVSIIVRDNGIGLPDSFDIKKSKGFGLELIRLLTDQINGQISFEKGEGTSCLLKFHYE
jgi:PAS domain S-box-containing protein